MSEELFNRWQARQDALGAMLAAAGASGQQYRVDLVEGRFWWQDAAGKMSFIADCKGLLSYAMSNRSVLMTWANESLAGAAIVDKVEGFEEEYDDLEPIEVWQLVLTLADAVGCDYVYRSPGAQSWFFLALWNVRPADADEAAPRPVGTPEEHVRDVLQRISATNHEDGAEVARTLLRNYGADIAASADHVWRGTVHAAALRTIGTALQALAADAADGAALDAGIDRIAGLVAFPEAEA